MATLELTKDNLDSTLDDNAIVIIDFWAEWCGPCKVFAPVFEAASNEHKDVVFAKLNTEEQPEVAQMFGIRSIPTVFAFRDNIGIFEQAGAMPPAAFDELIGKIKNLNMDEVRKKIEAAEAEEAGQAT